MRWQGELLHIHIAPKASAPMEELSEARLVTGIGLEGDRYATHLGTYSNKHHVDRQATLIEVEVLEALARDRGVELAPYEHRRNLTTRNVPLSHLVSQYFRIGECVLYGGRLNVPCIYLENLISKKVFKPLLNRSGFNCKNHRRRNHPHPRPDRVVRSGLARCICSSGERSNSDGAPPRSLIAIRSPAQISTRIHLTVAGHEVIHVLIAADAAQGEANMSELINETTEATATAAAKAPEAGNKKATPGARKPRVAKSEGKATKKDTAAKKTSTAAPKATPKPKAAKAAKTVKAKGVREGSKTEKILTLLKRPGGVTLMELMKQTDWQAHSVRGFLSAVVNKKMGLRVGSTKADNGDRTYSVTA